MYVCIYIYIYLYISSTIYRQVRSKAALNCVQVKANNCSGLKVVKKIILWENKLNLFDDLVMFLGLEMSGISVICPEVLAWLASEGQL